VFGIPGDGVNGLMEGCGAMAIGSGSCWCTHEEAAAYAKATGRSGCAWRRPARAASTWPTAGATRPGTTRRCWRSPGCRRRRCWAPATSRRGSHARVEVGLGRAWVRAREGPL